MCTSKCSCFFKLNPIETSDKDKDPSACTAFSDPCPTAAVGQLTML